MTLTHNQKQSLSFYQEIIDEAWKSESFKQELIKEPKPAIEKVIGKDLVVHEDTKFVVEDQSDPNFVYLNIPRKLDVENLELTDEQLEMVAGGILMISAATLGWIVAGTIVGGVAIGVGIAAVLD